MGCLQSKAQAEGGAESTSGLPPAPGGDGSPTTVILSEKATIEERAESLAKRWCACEAMMLQPSMEPERGETEPELGVGVGDKLESHGGMVHVPRGKHGKAEVVAADGQSLPTPEALDRLEDRIFEREAQRLRRLRSFKATLNALLVDPTARTSKTAAGIEALGDAVGKLDGAIDKLEPIVVERAALIAAADTLADVPGVAAFTDVRLDPKLHKSQVSQEIKRARATKEAYDASIAAAATTRNFLLAAVASATHAIRELQHELKVQRDGLNDTLRRAGGVCNAANFGGRAERHLVALNAERERLDAVARVARVMCDTATREAEMNVMREYEPELKTLKAQRDSAFMDGAKSVAFDDENWRAVPFARALLGEWRDTLAVRRAWEGMVDELSVEVIEEAIPAAQKEARYEIKEVMNAVFGWSSSSDESSSDDGDDEPAPPGSFLALTPKAAKRAGSRWRSMTWRKPANSPRLTTLASQAFERQTTQSMPEPMKPALPPEPSDMDSDEDDFQSAASSEASSDVEVSSVSSVNTEDLPITDDEEGEEEGAGSLPPMPAEPVLVSGLPPLRVE